MLKSLMNDEVLTGETSEKVPGGTDGADGQARSQKGGFSGQAADSVPLEFPQLSFSACIFLCSMSSLLPLSPLLPHLALPISLRIFSSPPCIVLACETGCGRAEVNLL